LAYFSLPGVKTIIMIVVSWLIVNTFGIDVMASLIAAYKSPATGPPVDPATISGPASRFITALILAGGSAGVNRIMVALGFRSVRTQEEVIPRPPVNTAWVAVRLKRNRAVGDVFVKIQTIGPAAGNPNAPAPIAGVIRQKRSQLSGLLFSQVDRFPPNGGHTVLPNTIYGIIVNGIDAEGNRLTALEGETYVLPQARLSTSRSPCRPPHRYAALAPVPDAPKSPTLFGCRKKRPPPPLNNRSPVSSSYRTTPNAQMSVRLSTRLPRACSGLM